ncbi:hypothetical protein GCM10027569_48700 [Flindersiella endophytica]
MSVVHGFYDFHLHFGRGPTVNPVPDNTARRARLAHESPLDVPAQTRRARLRPKVPHRQPRAIPDALWDELLAQMRCDRDRALLSCYVSSGARASELLGIRLSDIDWAKARLWVISKGSRRHEPVPASPEAFAYLACYLDQAGLPEPGMPVWRTRRGDPRPLTYWAMRQVLARANTVLGTNWTLQPGHRTRAGRRPARRARPHRPAARLRRLVAHRARPVRAGAGRTHGPPTIRHCPARPVHRLRHARPS